MSDYSENIISPKILLKFAYSIFKNINKKYIKSNRNGLSLTGKICL